MAEGSTRERHRSMAQGGESAQLTGDAAGLKKALRIAQNYPVAFVGSGVETEKLHIFNVLKELGLALPLHPIHPAGTKEAEKQKAIDEEEKKPNTFKDKATEYVYKVDNKPSVIISITGDADELPDDHELEEGVASLRDFCLTQKQQCGIFLLSGDAAHRAILANYVHNDTKIDEANVVHKEDLESFLEQKKGAKKRSMKGLKISYLIQKRIKELSTLHTSKATETESQFSKIADSACFKYPSVRDVLLDITQKTQYAVSRLFSLKFDFVLKPEAEAEPLSSGKRLPKSR